MRKHSGGTADDAAAWNFEFVQRVLGMSTHADDAALAAGGGGAGSGAAAIDFLLLAGIHTLLNHTAWDSGIMRLCSDRGVSGPPSANPLSIHLFVFIVLY